MKIAIDYTAASRQRAGIGRYTRALVDALARIDDENQYTLLVPRDARFVETGVDGMPRPPFPRNFRIRRAPLTERTLSRFWQRLSVPLPVETFTGPADVFYSPDFVLPPTGAPKKVLTVHDLSFRRVPETAAPTLKWYLEGAVPRSIARANLLLADSEATRRDLIDLYAVRPERVRTLYPGVESFFCRVSDPAQLNHIRERYALPGRFILNVGTIEPRKNLVTLIEAFSLLRGEPLPTLVIAGGRGWLYEDILRAPSRFGVADRVRFLGYVRDAELAPLYSLAELFVYPSLYEGFGLPVLEALACGTPVVTSNVASMPEVAGQAAALVDPHDAQALTAAMQSVLDDDRARAEMSRRGLEQAARFNWHQSALELLQALTS